MRYHSQLRCINSADVHTANPGREGWLRRRAASPGGWNSDATRSHRDIAKPRFSAVILSFFFERCTLLLRLCRPGSLLESISDSYRTASRAEMAVARFWGARLDLRFDRMKWDSNGECAFFLLFLHFLPFSGNMVLARCVTTPSDLPDREIFSWNNVSGSDEIIGIRPGLCTASLRVCEVQVRVCRLIEMHRDLSSFCELFVYMRASGVLWIDYGWLLGFVESDLSVDPNFLLLFFMLAYFISRAISSDTDRIYCRVWFISWYIGFLFSCFYF